MFGVVAELLYFCTIKEKAVEKDIIRVSWEHLPESDGGVHDEGPGQEGWAGEGVLYRVGGDIDGGDRQRGVSACET